jgi:hypothetical protein
MNEILLLSIVIVSAFVRDEERLGALFFGLLTSLFYISGELISDGFYYPLAGFFDFMMVCVFWAIHGYTRDHLTKILIFAEILSMIINCYGFFAYMNYSEPDNYNKMFDVFYMTILVLFVARTLPYDRFGRDDRNDNGNDGLHRINDMLCHEAKT